MNKLRQGTEQHKRAETTLQNLIDSRIISHHEKDNNSDNISDDFKSPDPTYNNESTGEDEYNPDTQNFLEIDWTCDNDGRWHPPDPPTDVPITINLTSTVDKHDQHGQNDSGANRIVTDNIHLLQDVTTINPLPMGGCNKHDEAAIVCTAIGNITISTTDGEQMKFKAYYSKDVDGTIISPTAMVRQHISNFSAWAKYANCDSNAGTLKMLGRDSSDNKEFEIFCKTTFGTIIKIVYFLHQQNQQSIISATQLNTSFGTKEQHMLGQILWKYYTSTPSAYHH